MLIPMDGAQKWGDTVGACGDAPCHAGAKVVIHAHSERGALLGGPYYGIYLSGTAIPWVVHSIGITDRMDMSISQLRELPTRSTEVRVTQINVRF